MCACFSNLAAPWPSSAPTSGSGSPVLRTDEQTMKPLARLVLALALVAASLTDAAALSRGARTAILSGVPGQVLRGGGAPADIDCNFATGFFWVRGQGVRSACPITFTRASPKACQT